MKILLNNAQVEAVIDAGYNPLDVFSKSMSRAKGLSMVKKTLKLSGFEKEEVDNVVLEIKSLNDDEFGLAVKDLAEQFF